MSNQLEHIIHDLEEAKAIDIVTLDVGAQTPLADYMIVATGRSSRHVKAIAHALMEASKKRNIPALSVHGMDSGDWVLVDFSNIIVHVMQQETRAYYDIENLWKPSEKN